MSGALILVVGGLVTVGVYLVTSRVLSRIVLGFALLGHAAVVALLAAGGPAGDPPLADRLGDDAASGGEGIANPLPQALSLTAIVISFGLTLFVLALARRQRELHGDDLVEDDLEDRRVAATEHVVDDTETDRFDETDRTDHLDPSVDDPDDGVDVGFERAGTGRSVDAPTDSDTTEAGS
ncbi:MAG: NADH-quinone oxidoreductase subunit K [Actinomycetota bacterium]